MKEIILNHAWIFLSLLGLATIVASYASGSIVANMESANETEPAEIIVPDLDMTGKYSSNFVKTKDK